MSLGPIVGAANAIVDGLQPQNLTPVWVNIARKYLGVAELPGAAENNTILGFWKTAMKKASAAMQNWLSTTLAKTEDTAWCATFVAAVMNESAVADPLPVKFYSAGEWSNFGVEQKIPKVGSLLVFKRTGGGHVGFYISEDATTYHVLGGNQSNSVSITRIAKDRLVSIRWPSSVDPKPYRPAVWTNFDSTISANES